MNGEESSPGTSRSVFVVLGGCDYMCGITGGPGGAVMKGIQVKVRRRW